MQNSHFKLKFENMQPTIPTTNSSYVKWCISPIISGKWSDNGRIIQFPLKHNGLKAAQSPVQQQYGGERAKNCQDWQKTDFLTLSFTFSHGQILLYAVLHFVTRCGFVRDAS